jgi:bifunctional oligoribonuclease and PAP phosphatase NrnA
VKKPKVKNTARGLVDWTPVLRLIRKYRTFLITTHVNPDGDGLGAESALYVALRKLGKRVHVVNHDALPKRFKYLAFSKAYRASDRIPPHDVCFVLDAGDFKRVREGVSRKEFGILVNIDHHFLNERFGDYNFVQPEASATGEIVYNLLQNMKVKIDKDIAEGIYTAIVTDTGRFRHSNTTPSVLRLAGELVELGANPEKVSDQVFAGISHEATELIRLALRTVKLHHRGTIASITLSQTDFKKSGALDEDTDNLVNFVRNLNRVRIALFLKELENGQAKLSLRTRGATNAALIARRFGGGGHAYAAGATLPGPLDRALNAVLSACRAVL